MLSIRKLQKCANEPKLHEGQTCIKPQKDGSKSSQQQAQVSNVMKFRNLRNLQVANFRNPRNLQVANFRNPRNLQVANFCNLAKFPMSSFSSVFLLQISSGSIMHLRIRLRFIVFESD